MHQMHAADDAVTLLQLTTGAGVNKYLNHNLQSSSGHQYSILHHNAAVPACVHGIIQSIDICKACF